MSHLQQLRKGSTSLLILSVLEEEAKYGYQIMRELESRSEGYFSMTAALLYPALHRLEREGYVVSDWRTGDSKRRRKYYTITDDGKQALADSLQEWQTFFSQLFGLLNKPPRFAEEGL
jgi:DNA-binding PadR family transcriptional regulator